MKSPIIDETATNISYQLNGFAHNSNSYSGNQSNSNVRQNGLRQQQQQQQQHDQHQQPQINRKESNGFCDGKENQHQTNGTELSNGFHSSPLRSQLGLNLKTSTTSVKKSTNLLTVIRSLFYFSFIIIPNENINFYCSLRFPVPNLSVHIGECHRFGRAYKSFAL